MATWHQMQNPSAMAAAYKPESETWKVIVNKPDALMYSARFKTEKEAKAFVRKRGGQIIEPLPRLPFIIRRAYYHDSKEWELIAAFPTIAADSAIWYDWEAVAENGDSFGCCLEFWQSTRHVRGFDPARVAAFEERVRRDWENDSDYPCTLIRYERKSRWMDEQRERDWRESRKS